MIFLRFSGYQDKMVYSATGLSWMTRRKRTVFPQEFKLEAARLVLAGQAILVRQHAIRWPSYFPFPTQNPSRNLLRSKLLGARIVAMNGLLISDELLAELHLGPPSFWGST